MPAKTPEQIEAAKKAKEAAKADAKRADDEKAAADEAGKPKKKTPLKTELIFLNWKPKRALIIHPQQEGVLGSYQTDPKATLTREQAKANLKFKPEFRMNTGTNAYDLSNWNRIKDNEAISGPEGLLENEELVIWTNGMLGLEGNPAGFAQRLPATLENVPTRVAVELVTSIVPTDGKYIPKDILEQWQKAEEDGGAERTSVIKALESQIAAMKKAREIFEAQQ